MIKMVYWYSAIRGWYRISGGWDHQYSQWKRGGVGGTQCTPPDIYHFDFLLFVVDGAGLFITTPQPTTRDVLPLPVPGFSSAVSPGAAARRAGTSTSSRTLGDRGGADEARVQMLAGRAAYETRHY